MCVDHVLHRISEKVCVGYPNAVHLVGNGKKIFSKIASPLKTKASDKPSYLPFSPSSSNMHALLQFVLHIFLLSLRINLVSGN
jgi:hypothetical protein